MSVKSSYYDPLDPAVVQDPYPHYAKLRENAPVHWIESMQGYAVSRWEDVQVVLRDTSTYSSMKFWPALLGPFDPVPEVLPLLSLDPPRHTIIRKLANKAFIPKLVNALEERFRQIANGLIDGIVLRHGKMGAFDFVEEFSGLYPVSTISELLGVDVDRREEFTLWAYDILSASSRSSFSAARAAEVENSKNAMRAYFEDLYDKRSAVPGDDMFSNFIHAEADGERLSRVEAMNLGVLLLLGGTETTSNLIATTVAYFGGFDRLKGAEYEGKLMPLIDEMLRLEAPTQVLFRHTTCDTELAGVAIAKDTLVMPLLGSANRDPSRFDYPDSFQLGRMPRENLTFGQGPHACVASYLARMETKVALEVLSQRFAKLETAGEPVRWIEYYFARGPRTLQVSYHVAA